MADPATRVKDLIDTPFSQTLGPLDRLDRACERVLDEFTVNTVPVVDAGKLVGVLRVSTLLAHCNVHRGDRTNRRVVLKHLTAERVVDVMKPPPIRLHPTDPLHRAAEAVLTTRWHELPVVEEDETFVGMLTARALVRAQWVNRSCSD